MSAAGIFYTYRNSQKTGDKLPCVHISGVPLNKERVDLLGRLNHQRPPQLLTAAKAKEGEEVRNKRGSDGREGEAEKRKHAEALSVW